MLKNTIVYSIILIISPFLFVGWIFPTTLHIFGFTISLIISIYLSYTIYFCMVCFAFWFGEVRSIVVAYNVGMLMISGQYIPIRLFPENILSIIQWTSIPYLVDLPVSIATGIIVGYEWIELFLYGLIWCIILTGISFFIYRIGIKDYEAFGQ